MASKTSSQSSYGVNVIRDNTGLNNDLVGNGAYDESDLLDKSVSILPQKETRTQTPNSQVESLHDETSLEISGFTSAMPSGAQYSSESNDPFNSVFYRVLPSANKTHIHFYATPLFKTILSVLEKEFCIPGEDVNKFMLKTYIEGKRCQITVDRTDLSIVATGPGHVYWKERNFRKMTFNMFKEFVD